jgi:hypothetical protein
MGIRCLHLQEMSMYGVTDASKTFDCVFRQATDAGARRTTTQLTIYSVGCSEPRHKNPWPTLRSLVPASSSQPWRLALSKLHSCQLPITSCVRSNAFYTFAVLVSFCLHG